MQTGRLPLIVLTGALGAGKTTLLNGALRDPAMARTALIVNEFGDVGIDHLLMQASSDHTIELSGGCLCCAVRGAFTDGLTDLLMARRGDFDRIIVETSGLADPGPILTALHAHPFLSTAIRSSGVVCAVDSSARIDAAGASEFAAPEFASQVVLADRIVLTKTDVTAPSKRLTDCLAAMAPAADMMDVSALGFTPAHAFSPMFVARKFRVSSVPTHGERAAPIAVSLVSDRPMAVAHLDQFLNQLMGRYGANLLRVKGLVWTKTDGNRPLLVQAVGQVLAPFERLDCWAHDGAETRLVVICRAANVDDVTRLFASFNDGVAADLPDADALANNPLAVPGVRF
ncbi:MAG: GTP-binding protein [Pseudomonadota bacterium]